MTPVDRYSSARSSARGVHPATAASSIRRSSSPAPPNAAYEYGGEEEEEEEARLSSEASWLYGRCKNSTVCWSNGRRAATSAPPRVRFPLQPGRCDCERRVVSARMGSCCACPPAGLVRSCGACESLLAPTPTDRSGVPTVVLTERPQLMPIQAPFWRPDGFLPASYF